MIAPNGSISYSDSLTLGLPKATDTSFETSYWKQETLEGLRKLSPFYLRLEGCDLLGDAFKTDAEPRMKFAKALQIRWRSYGLLLIGTFISEPIFVDLGSADKANTR